MKKVILSASLVITATVLIMPAFLPREFTISRDIAIDAPVEKVHSNLADFKEFIKWNPFSEGDATNKATIEGVGLGSSMHWSGERTGEGKMTIIRIDPGKEIETRMDFVKPMPGQAFAIWETTSIDQGKTRLVWKYRQENSYFKRFLGLFMKGVFIDIFDKGLSSYKALLEEK